MTGIGEKDQLVRVGIRQFPEQNAIDDAEDGGRRADSHSHDRHDRQCKSGPARQASRDVPQFLK